MRGKTLDTPDDLQVEIFFKEGGSTIIPKANRDRFVRLNAYRISYIETGGKKEKLPELNVEDPTVEDPTISDDPSMQWSRPKLLEFAKDEKGIKYSKKDIAKGGVTKTEILSDILIHESSRPTE